MPAPSRHQFERQPDRQHSQPVRRFERPGRDTERQYGFGGVPIWIHLKRVGRKIKGQHMCLCLSRGLCGNKLAAHASYLISGMQEDTESVITSNAVRNHWTIQGDSVLAVVASQSARQHRTAGQEGPKWDRVGQGPAQNSRAQQGTAGHSRAQQGTAQHLWTPACRRPHPGAGQS